MLLADRARGSGAIIVNYSKGVAINAGDDGGSSTAPRRGLSVNSSPEKEIGALFVGTPLTTDHSDPAYTCRTYLAATRPSEF